MALAICTQAACQPPPTANCEPSIQMPPSARPLARLVAFTAMLALGFACGAAPARADGDPASDVLATQPLFLPQDAGLPVNQQAALADLLETTRRIGYPIRVALIASPTDLGSVTELWRQPQTYARFLGQELSLTYRGPLLVVMPNGFGFAGFSRPITNPRAATAGVRLSDVGGGLGSATVEAVQRLAARAGHRLPTPTATAAPPHAGASDPTQWIVLGIGAVVIAAAWIESLRTRPLRLRRSSSPTA